MDTVVLHCNVIVNSPGCNLLEWLIASVSSCQHLSDARLVGMAFRICPT
uniref:Uncharacterized protein n=1 Tax=Arundo donax TaxID=35708 RepID=A0A0A9GQV3_ARUDO